MKPTFQSLVVLGVSIASLSFGSVLLKMGVNRYVALTGSGVCGLHAFLRTPQLPGGMALMLLQFFGTLLLFKLGWDASVVMPSMGLCYVSTAILGKWLLGEPVNALRWTGIVLVLIGVFCIARSVVQNGTP